ncbi:plasmid replication DNA-binding protein KfrA, partial [Modestobacter roseus]
MARKSTITPETVAAAAEALIARGEPVTNKSVLSEIGSGSMSTLVPLLQT